MGIEFWLQILFTIGPIIALGGVLYEKVRQIEKRLGGNGASIPGECKVHTERLDGHDRRIHDLELKPLGD